MPGLSTNQLITAAIVALVIVVSLKAGGGVVQSANKVTRIVGIELGPPSINTFTATPDGKGNMQFQMFLGGDPTTSELAIYQAYTATPDKDAGVPNYIEANRVLHLISSSDPTGEKLAKQLETLKTGIVCPVDGGDKGCDSSSRYEAGGYTLGAVLKKNDKTIDAKEVKTGFYNENYVEMLHTNVSGCKDNNFHDCNVVECKKELINNDLLDSSGFVLQLRRQSGLLKKISNEFISENRVAGDCGKVGDARGRVVADDRDPGATFFVLAGCSDENIDKLNIKVARARLLESAYHDSGNTITSEDQYVRSLDRLGFWREQAVKMTMSCTAPLGWLNAPKGAYPALQSIGWQLVSPDGRKDIWRGKVSTELDRVLGSVVSPIITQVTAGTNSENQVALAWNVPLGKDGITAYQLKLSYSPAAVNEKLSDANSEANKIQLSQISLANQPLKGDLSYRYPVTGGLTTSQMGAYWFELTDFGSQGQSSKVEARTGIYDNNYIELYRDLIGVNDACGSGCDVAGKKESVLGNNAVWSYTQNAFDNHKSEFQASCHLEPKNPEGEKRISGCLPSEVDVLYRDAVTAYGNALPAGALKVGKTVSDLLSADCNKDNWMENYQRFKDNGIKVVCDTKIRLKLSLDSSHWGYTGS